MTHRFDILAGIKPQQPLARGYHVTRTRQLTDCFVFNAPRSGGVFAAHRQTHTHPRAHPGANNETRRLLTIWNRGEWLLPFAPNLAI